MTTHTAPKPRPTVERPNYYIGRFTQGQWVKVVPNADRSVLTLKFSGRGVRPFGEKGGAA